MTVFKDLKVDFPAILALNIFITFAAVIICSMFIKTPIDDGLRQALIGIVMLMVGFYFGSSTGSKNKDDTQNKIVEKLTSTQPAGAPGPVAPIAAPSAGGPWWPLLTDEERNAITSITGDSRVLEFQINAKIGRADFSDLAYLVRIGALTQARADAIAAS